MNKRQWPITEALVSVEPFVSGKSSAADATVPGTAIEEPIFKAMIGQVKTLFPNDPLAFIEAVALAFFRCGMLYERVLCERRSGIAGTDNQHSPDSQKEGKAEN